MSNGFRAKPFENSRAQFKDQVSVGAVRLVTLNKIFIAIGLVESAEIDQSGGFIIPNNYIAMFCRKGIEILRKM